MSSRLRTIAHETKTIGERGRITARHDTHATCAIIDAAAYAVSAREVAQWTTR